MRAQFCFFVTALVSSALFGATKEGDGIDYLISQPANLMDVSIVKLESNLRQYQTTSDDPTGVYYDNEKKKIVIYSIRYIEKSQINLETCDHLINSLRVLSGIRQDEDDNQFDNGAYLASMFDLFAPYDYRYKVFEDEVFLKNLRSSILFKVKFKHAAKKSVIAICTQRLGEPKIHLEFL